MTELRNRSAFHEYYIEDTYVAGMVLGGTEVKSLRAGKASFNDSYCYFNDGELFVRSLHISEYAFGTTQKHEPLQERKLLLTKKELKKLAGKSTEKGYTIVPLRIFFNEKNLAKLEIGLGKGKKLHDKRDTIKARDTEKEMKRYL
ncbi:MAG: SsrA-binding protein SmpB, partial [Bacteroidota bacterium]|nr:SsrA-binding protein SmpB [Bacteroidota bacterium]